MLRCSNLFALLTWAFSILDFSTTVTASNGFTYNNDAECSIPFTQASIYKIDCQKQSSRQSYETYDEDADGCYFGDTITVSGSFVLDQQVNRYFTMALDMCYYGSTSMNFYYKPERCHTYRRTVDMGALLEQQGDQGESEQTEAKETYLDAGAHSFNIALTIPSKLFPFGNASQLRIKLKLTPRASYSVQYYRSSTYYEANIKDSKYQTQCYLSFDSIPVDESQQVYNIYTMAGFGVLLLGLATYGTSKRRVLCSCDQCGDDGEEADANYQEHVEFAASRQIDFSMADSASVLSP